MTDSDIELNFDSCEEAIKDGFTTLYLHDVPDKGRFWGIRPRDFLCDQTKCEVQVTMRLMEAE